ncbi:MAG: chemotaxis protein CheD [Deltaproteobacteria bacterium]|nr:chemotaxis protein CheD [Deltaproteobacteria bacterium]MBN2688548.1 chemotaxis protein CheD [Deltaproteobacteria bacterium]
MTHESGEVLTSNYFLEPGYIFIASEPTVISTVLGSSVAVCIYDRKRKTGGMNHFLFPEPDKGIEPTAQYGNAATTELIRMMKTDGSQIKHLESQILGGGYNPDVSSIDIGRRNIMVARRVLTRHGIRVVSEDVGGAKGRKIVFHSNINEIAILKVDRIRRSDWYPYEGHR